MNKCEFEPYTTKCIQEIMETGENYIDIGANVGIHSFMVAGMPNTKVLSIDASPIAFSKLVKSQSIN